MPSALAIAVPAMIHTEAESSYTSCDSFIHNHKTILGFTSSLSTLWQVTMVLLFPTYICILKSLGNMVKSIFAEEIKCSGLDIT